MSQTPQEIHASLELHPNLVGKKLLDIEPFGMDRLMRGMCATQKLTYFYSQDIVFAEHSTLLQYMRQEKHDIVVIEPNVDDNWRNDIDALHTAGIPVVVLENHFEHLRPDTRKFFDHFRNEGISVISKKLIRKDGNQAYFDALVRALDKAVAARKH